MLEAVRRAYGLCQPGDAVVLSPACSSYDMFQDYVDRGGAFRRAAEQIAAREKLGPDQERQ
jgi:UDP-N-acetylmuramoylalanine--D-glutamate ligase